MIILDKKWIAYVGPFNFPWGQAGSRRVFGNAKSIVSAGYDVVVGSGDKFSSIKSLETCEYSGSTLSYLGLNELPVSSGYLQRLWQHLFASGKNTSNWLSAQETKPEYVIIYGGLAAFGWHIYRWCKKNNVPVIADVVEWYDPSQMLGGRFGPFYLSANVAFHYLYPRFDGVIAISHYLADYFSRYTPVVIVPPTLTVDPIEETGTDISNCLKLVYAGTPGKKDLLDKVVEAVSRVELLGVEIQLTVIGPSERDVIKMCGLQCLPNSVVVAGRVPQDRVAQLLKASDFSILIRDSLRFTNAGFPTKFVESLAAGVPVIANITSDLGSYLRDGSNGLEVGAPDISAIMNALLRAASLSVSERDLMKRNAKNDAKVFFSSDAYVQSFKQFLFVVNQKHKGTRALN